jgi:glycosyltransferase involved in cell wall biosynthesis
MVEERLALVVGGQSLAGGGGAQRRIVRVIVHILSTNDHVAAVTLVCSSRLLADLAIVVPGLEMLLSAHRMVHADLGRAMVGSIIKPWALKRLLVTNGVSRVHLLLVQRSLLPVLLTRVLERDFSLTCSVTSSPLSYGSDGRILSSLALRLECEQAGRIDCLYDYFLETYPQWRDKCWVTPCSFTDYEQFRPLDKEPVIVFAGSLTRMKQPLLALKGFAEARERFPFAMKGWRLAVYGSGELSAAVRRQIVEYDLESWVILSHKPDLAQALGHSSVFLSLQEHENYPSQALLEALACGNVPVCTDVGGTRRMVSPETAVLLADNNSSTVARAIVDACLMSRREGIQTIERASILRSHTIDAASEYYTRFLDLSPVVVE